MSLLFLNITSLHQDATPLLQKDIELIYKKKKGKEYHLKKRESVDIFKKKGGVNLRGKMREMAVEVAIFHFQHGKNFAVKEFNVSQDSDAFDIIDFNASQKKMLIVKDVK